MYLIIHVYIPNVHKLAPCNTWWLFDT